ncbi:MAG: cytochrome c3 family protein, partial [Desulfobulbaceae bacterium]|nr:cytochrome c3 family protein [Desulfobulbaceae bacterium]
MLKRSLSIALTLLFVYSLAIADDAGLHYPHYSINDIGCLSCHYESTENPPEWFTHIPQDLDDTPYNNLCNSCHNNIIATSVKPHSSLTTSTRYHPEKGGWAIECRHCHWVHHQYQTVMYGSPTYLYSGTSTEVTTTTVTQNGASWNSGQYNGYILIPNINQVSYNYLITNTTSDTLTVETSGSHPEPIDLSRTAAGDTFAIIYGKLIRPYIPTPNSGYKQARYFNNNGSNSFADGDTIVDGVCQICHTEANHFLNTGEINPEHGGDGYDHSITVGTYCMTCHPHTTGFSHGGSTGGGNCEECH